MAIPPQSWDQWFSGTVLRVICPSWAEVRFVFQKPRNRPEAATAQRPQAPLWFPESWPIISGFPLAGN